MWRLSVSLADARCVEAPVISCGGWVTTDPRRTSSSACRAELQPVETVPRCDGIRARSSPCRTARAARRVVAAPVRHTSPPVRHDCRERPSVARARRARVSRARPPHIWRLYPFLRLLAKHPASPPPPRRSPLRHAARGMRYCARSPGQRGVGSWSPEPAWTPGVAVTCGGLWSAVPRCLAARLWFDHPHRTTRHPYGERGRPRPPPPPPLFAVCVCGFGHWVRLYANWLVVCRVGPDVRRAAAGCGSGRCD